MEPDPVQGRVLVLNHFPGYSSTAQTSRFWGEIFFPSFSIKDPTPQTPPCRPDRPGPVSSLGSPQPSQLELLHQALNIVSRLRKSLMPCAGFCFPCYRTTIFSQRKKEIFPSRLQLSVRGGGWRLSPSLHPSRAGLLNQGGSVGPRAGQASWSQ